MRGSVARTVSDVEAIDERVNRVDGTDGDFDAIALTLRGDAAGEDHASVVDSNIDAGGVDGLVGEPASNQQLQSTVGNRGIVCGGVSRRGVVIGCGGSSGGGPGDIVFGRGVGVV